MKKLSVVVFALLVSACTPANEVCTGDFVLQTNESLKLLEECRVLDGNLIVDGVSSLAPLHGLEVVTGDLRIVDTTASLEPLSTVQSVRNLAIVGNTNVITLHGLRGLKNAGGEIAIVQNRMLVTYAGLDLDHFYSEEENPTFRLMLLGNEAVFNPCSATDIADGVTFPDDAFAFYTRIEHPSFDGETSNYWTECQDAPANISFGGDPWYGTLGQAIMLDDPNP